MGGGAMLTTSVVKMELETTVSEDKDMMCPICIQVIWDAFLTACGHSFCHSCIATHLRAKSDCPCCGQYLTPNLIFPNFLLDKLLRKSSAYQRESTGSSLESLRRKLQEGCDISIREVEGLLSLLEEKKRKMELQESESGTEIMIGFLHRLRRQKLEELNELQADLDYIKEDIVMVERRRLELYREKQERLRRLRMIGDDQQNNDDIAYNAQYVQAQMSSINLHSSRAVANDDMQISTRSMQPINSQGILSTRKRRVHSQFNDLEECYLQKRRNGKKQIDLTAMDIDYNPVLEDFHDVLKGFTKYSRLRVVSELRQGDIFHSANIVSSIEFDRDEELFATAGVSRCIKVFEFSSVINEPEDIHCAVEEISTRSKLSCLSWNKYLKNQIASSDYEGIITVWDVNTRQSVMSMKSMKSELGVSIFQAPIRQCWCPEVMTARSKFGV